MRSLGVAVALTFCSAPALAQDLPLPLPPFVVPVPVPVPLPFPFPMPTPAPAPGAQPAPVPSALPLPYPVPLPAAEQAPPPPPEPWRYAVTSEPPPPAPSKKVRGVVLAADFGAALPIRSPDTKTAGYGGDLRAGYRFALGPVVWLSPEATVGLVGFPQYDGALRFGLGGHLGFDAGVVEPSIYAFGGGFVNVWKQGPGFRTGAALDFRAGRYAIPGFHVDYNQAGWDTGGVRYASVGAHLGFLVGK